MPATVYASCKKCPVAPIFPIKLKFSLTSILYRTTHGRVIILQVIWGQETIYICSTAEWSYHNIIEALVFISTPCFKLQEIGQDRRHVHLKTMHHGLTPTHLPHPHSAPKQKHKPSQKAQTTMETLFLNFIAMLTEKILPEAFST